MTKTSSDTTRRTALKLLSGATLAALGASETATGEVRDETDRTPRKSSEFGGATEWVLRLEEPEFPQVGSDQEAHQQLASAAATSQAGVIQALEQRDHVRVINRLWITNAILVAVDEDKVDPTSELAQLDGVENVHPNFEIDPPEPIDESLITPLTHGVSTYGLDQVNAIDVWDTFETRGSGARVAVLDTGVDPDHPAIDLASGGWAFFNARGERVPSEPFDPNGHGTHVSGTATGGQATNTPSEFHIGVAPDAELYHAKVLNDGGSFVQIATGIQWAVTNKADVINMSLGATGYFPQLIAPVRRAMQLGTFVVAASGNDGAGESGSPGNYYDTMSAGATNISGDVASFSSGEQIYTPADWGTAAPDDWPTYYTTPDVSAPGVSVLSSVPGGGYARFSGTSMASPHTAGLAALAVSSNPDLTPERLTSLIRTQSVHPEGESADPRYGEGIADAFRSVTAVESEGEVVGAVTDANGDPVQGVSILSSYGTRAVSGPDGNFNLPVPNATVTLVAADFGLSGGPISVSVDGRTETDITVTPTVDVDPISGQRPDMAASPVTSSGEYAATEIELEVANVEEYAVELSDASANLSKSDVTITIGNNSLQPGESVTFSTPFSGQVTASVDVASGTTDGAKVGLQHTFRGPGPAQSLTTGPTTVRQNPTPPTFEITKPNFDPVVGSERLLTFAPTITNTGDLAATQTIQFVVTDFQLTPNGDPITVPFEVRQQLTKGEQTQLTFPVGFSEYPRQTATQVILTADDQASATFEYQAGSNKVQQLRLPDTVTVGDTFKAEITLKNQGNLKQPLTVKLQLSSSDKTTEPIPVAARSVAIAPGQTKTVTIPTPTDGLIPGTYTIEAVGLNNLGNPVNTKTTQVTMAERKAPVVTGRSALDPDGDGIYEDVNGDGAVNIADVQALFANRNSDAVRNNEAAFDFNGDGDFNVADVQRFFQQVS